MATISNLKLEIKKGSRSSKVIVTYDLCFSKCELKAQFMFLDKVVIMGEDPGKDQFLFTLFKGCVKAEKTCISRSHSRTIPNDALDEDKKFLWWELTDEIYAKVIVKPYDPGTKTATSNIISSYF